MVSTEDKCVILAPDSWDAYGRNDFSEHRLLPLLIHRKPQYLLTWDAASWVWSPKKFLRNKTQVSTVRLWIFLSLQYKVDTFQRQKKKTYLSIWNTGTDGRHFQKDPCDKQLELLPPLFHKIVEWTLTVWKRYREEPILTPCWICFSDFNLCFCYCEIT